METVLYMGLVNWLATWIWVDGEVFREVRQLVDDNAPRYLGARLGEKCKYLVHCPLCAGTWIGFGLSLLVPGPIAPIAGSIIGWFLNGLLYKAAGHLILEVATFARHSVEIQKQRVEMATQAAAISKHLEHAAGVLAYPSMTLVSDD